MKLAKTDVYTLQRTRHTRLKRASQRYSQLYTSTKQYCSAVSADGTLSPRRRRQRCSSLAADATHSPREASELYSSIAARIKYSSRRESQRSAGRCVPRARHADAEWEVACWPARVGGSTNHGAIEWWRLYLKMQRRTLNLVIIFHSTCF